MDLNCFEVNWTLNKEKHSGREGEEVMKCEDVNKLLADYLDGEATSEERVQIEAHLQTCGKCRKDMRLLASIQNGLRQALGARAARVEPSPQVWERVRQRIESKNPFWEKVGTMVNRPLWRVAIPIVTILIVVGALWGSGVLPGSTTPVPVEPGSIPPLPFELSAVPVEAHYLPGEPVEVKYLLTNVSSEVITLDPYPAEIQVRPGLDYDRVLLSVAGGTQTLEINPGDTVTQEFTWDQKDVTGKQVLPGWYSISFRDISVRQGDTRIGFNPGTRVLIQYPQGAMEKSFDLNQSQTANGITVTLERIELMADSSRFYFFFIPPGYTAPPTGLGPSISVMARAEYSVGGITKSAGTAGFNTEDNGIRLVWKVGPGKLDPVPSDATEITFTITQINEWQGPWEFGIPLE